jgi:photosystem II stability/assembly factor-like uncharacterized protein
MERKLRTLKISLLVFILSITISAQEGWFQQISGTNYPLYGVCFTDSNNGTTVGGNGTILRTSNGGITWMTQTSGTTYYLSSVFFTDSNNGIAVGELGTILRTTNGGTNWISQTSGTIEWLGDVYFSDVNNGTAVGIGGIILRTTNGGTSWTSQSSGTFTALMGVSFSNASVGTVVGGYGTVLKTTNGGTTWISQSSGISSFLVGVTSIDENNVIAVGDSGTILKTTDGGTTWTSQTSGTSYVLYGVSFTDLDIGTAVGNGGTILRTIDGGAVWTSQSSGVENALYGVFFTDSSEGTAVGDSGIILRTVNGGIPVELISFTAEVFECKIELNWSSATEINNSGFEIFRFIQNENNEWNTIGFVLGHGTTTETQNYFFTDNDVKPGKYQYKLKQIDYDGTFEYSQVVEVEIPFVNEFSLSQNYPNPFNPTTSLQYAISSRQFVTLKVYDLLGREVAILVNEEKPAGEYEVEFNGANLPSGIYFYQLKAGEYIETRKMVLLR